MQCTQDLDLYLSSAICLLGVIMLVSQKFTPATYGKHVDVLKKQTYIMVPAKCGWFLQELPSFLVPFLLVIYSPLPGSPGCRLLLLTFCAHYFHRTFIYSLFTRGRPAPLHIVISAVIFCSCNGFLQGHCMVYNAKYSDGWYKDISFLSGMIVFLIGMAINIHSDHILRNLRQPGEETYKIPQGGFFNYVSGANFLGEIVEWFGYAIATWTMPAFSFAFFTLCSIGPRAYHHHKFYLKKFTDYPKSRKVLIPFIF
uniref:3-oxo-5alpha-steroid 4-dehydrogenase (NADP(+)) n=1 Tax=Hypselotriton orientalis TaxID=3399148 RepID=A0A6H0DVY1_9SALA|nr:steroid 5-a reductase 2 SDR5A2 [Cynops orientalis]